MDTPWGLHCFLKIGNSATLRDKVKSFVGRALLGVAAADITLQASGVIFKGSARTEVDGQSGICSLVRVSRKKDNVSRASSYFSKGPASAQPPFTEFPPMLDALPLKRGEFAGLSA